MKLSLGEGGVQGLLVRHCEKIALGTALLLMLGFMYWGWSIETYEQTPGDLKQLVERAQSHINSSTWTEYRDERVPPSNFAARVDQGRDNILPHEYAMPHPLKPAESPPVVKRSDPQLFAPVQLEVASVIGPVAAPSQGRTDLLALKETTIAEEKEERSRSGGREDAGGGFPGAPGAEGMLGGMLGGGPGGMMGDSGAEGMMGGSDGGMGGLGSGAAGATTRKMPASWAPGWRPASNVSSPGQPPTLVPKSRNMISVKALVPYEQQVDEFQRILENSFGYVASLDKPKYVAFVAERAEVGSDPAAAPNWVKVSSTGLAIQEIRDWVAAGTELADPDYLLPNVLTMPIPPLMMRSHDGLFTHSEIPRKNAAGTSTGSDSNSSETTEEPKDESGNPDLPEDLPSFAGPGGAGLPGMGPGGPGGSPPGMGPGMDSGSGSGMGAPGMGAPGMGGPGGMGAGSPGMDGSFATEQVTRYKMIRFYDMTAEPGKKYIYRVQVWLEDPNRPKDREMSLRVLEADVLTRLQDVAKEEQASGGRRIWYRKSEWSQPSDPISLPDMRHVYAGSTEELRRSQVITTSTGARMQLEDPVGTVSAVSWDPRFAVDVALEAQVQRGSVLNAVKDIPVVHPVSLDFKTLDQYNFQTDAIVVDIRGGEDLGTRNNPIPSLGNYLVFQADGSVHVHNELDDIDNYRRFTYADEQAGQTGSFGGGSGMMDGSGGMPGMPGGGMPGMPGGIPGMPGLQGAGP